MNAERKAAQVFKDENFQIRGEIHDAQQPPQGYRIKNNANFMKIKNKVPAESTDDVHGFYSRKYKSNDSQGSNYRNQFRKMVTI